MGAEARIDMQPSGDWLREATASWPFPVHIKVQAPPLCLHGSLLVPIAGWCHARAQQCC